MPRNRPLPAEIKATGVYGVAAMKLVWLILVVTAITSSSLARAEDFVEMVSRYRREHSLPAVTIDPELMAVAEHQAKAMAASGIMDHGVAGSFHSRMASAHAGRAGENIAAGQQTWAEALRGWQTSPGHNANLLLTGANILGFAMARNDRTEYKTFWAMVIGEKRPNDKPKTETDRGKGKAGTGENPIGSLKKLFCPNGC
jgi:uncharacterized protein YkwD